MSLTITLPEQHAGQVQLDLNKGRFNVVRCGRRFGKSVNLICRVITAALLNANKNFGVFTPTSKQWGYLYDEIRHTLGDCVAQRNKLQGEITLRNGAKILFFHMDDNPLAGRGKDFKGVYIDEAAYSDTLETVYMKQISAALLKDRGEVWIYSTPNGIKSPKTGTETFFYQLTKNKNWIDHHAPTSANPFIPLDEIEAIKHNSPPDVYRQEIEAEFVDWSGKLFFEPSTFMVKTPEGALDAVYCVIDTANKVNAGADGTAVVYFGLQHDWSDNGEIKFFILDWSIEQISANLLIEWLPSVDDRLLELGKQYGVTTLTNLPIWIEDKSSGIALIGEALARGFNVAPLPEKLVALGKHARAIDASSLLNKLRVTPFAKDKSMQYKGLAHNHLYSQLLLFRYLENNANDDLLDCFCYGLLLDKKWR